MRGLIVYTLIVQIISTTNIMTFWEIVMKYDNNRSNPNQATNVFITFVLFFFEKYFHI